jgi:hypothetical protein
MINAAMKPNTTLGRLAIISVSDFNGARSRGDKNSLVKIAANKANGTPNNIE